MSLNDVKIFLLPGGKMPVRMSEEAAGFDVHLRAIVSATEMDPSNPKLRKTLFDFKEPPKDERVARDVFHVDWRFVYRLRPRHSIMFGIGIITEMVSPLFFLVAPRSGLASKHGIQVTNAPGTVDADYRGEAGVLAYNLNEEETFDFELDMRIAQIVFLPAIIPNFTVVAEYTDLSDTKRGAGGFGSTGLKG
mgnify:CR=1 FL=1